MPGSSAPVIPGPTYGASSVGSLLAPPATTVLPEIAPGTGRGAASLVELWWACEYGCDLLICPGSVAVKRQYITGDKDARTQYRRLRRRCARPRQHRGKPRYDWGAGWTTIVLGLFHVGYPPKQNEAEIFFNSTSIIKGGKDAGEFSAGFDPAWPEKIAELKQKSQITRIYASFGGGYPVVDFQTIQNIYKNNHSSFNGTALEQNLKLLRDTFPAIDGIDMDCEEAYDQASFVAFCEMAIDNGFEITFCPYDRERLCFWTGALQTLERAHPGRVKWWNLQCYDGGDQNDPNLWATGIRTTLPDFDTDGFIVAGDWSRNLAKPSSDPSSWFWQGDCPVAMGQSFSSKKGKFLGGGFVWTIDDIIYYVQHQHEKSDPKPCGNVGMSDYIAAIRSALGS